MRLTALILLLTQTLCFGVTLNNKSVIVGRIISRPPIVMQTLTNTYSTSCAKVARRGTKHFVPVTTRVGNDSIPYIMTWDTLANVEFISLPDRNLSGGNDDLAEPVCEWVTDSRIMIASRNSSGGPIRVTEYELSGSNLTLTNDFTFGDVRTIIGASCALDDGSAAFAFHSKDPPDTPDDFIVHLTVGWRTNGVWQTNSFDLPAGVASHFPAFLSMNQGVDGGLYVFFHMDSWGSLGMAKFTNNASGIGLVTQSNIVDGLSSSISGEHPRVSSIRDGNRIVLIHQLGGSVFHPECPDTIHPTSQTIVMVAVYTNLTFEKIGELPWESLHINNPILACWPRPNGFYFFADRFSDCAVSWRAGLLDNSTNITVFQEFIEGDVLSRSDDGYIIFQPEPPATNTTLIKVGFAPIMTIDKMPLVDGRTSDVRIDWDEAVDGDIVEASSDLKSWKQLATSGKPVIVANADSEQFFRVRRNLV